MRAPAAALLVSLSLVAAAAGAAPRRYLRADCRHLRERPASVTIACGDGNLFATGVRWSRWGGAVARATATAHANDCTPNCALGHFRSYRATLSASRPRACSGGRIAYTRLSISFVHGPRRQTLPEGC